MPRPSRQDWLSSGSPARSRSDLLEQLATASAASPGGVSQSGAGVSSTMQEIAANALQGTAKDITEQISSLASQMSNLSSLQQTQIGAIQDNTQAVLQNTTVKVSGGTSTVGTVADMASSFLGGGLSLSPLIGGLLSLFGGGSEQSVTVPAPFTLPAPVQYQVGLTSGAPGQATPVSYGESGQPRAQASSNATQVTIQVQAMDSQSILDHSDDIATAVKTAILNSHSLSDVITDL